jgi:hypothetical protein
MLDAEEAQARLRTVALGIGLDERAVDGTIRSGCTAGLAAPRTRNLVRREWRWRPPTPPRAAGKHRGPPLMRASCGPFCHLGPRLAPWVRDAAAAKGAPADYVMGALLSVARSVIGNARWVTP